MSYCWIAPPEAKALMDLLEPLTGQDAYATPSFFGIIHGTDFFITESGKYRTVTGEELKELILTRLRTAYEEAVKKVDSVPLTASWDTIRIL